MAGSARYAWQREGWPAYSWRPLDGLEPVRRLQTSLLDRMTALGVLQQNATAQTVTLETIHSAKIEGEHLDERQVRSSVARRLGLDTAGLPAATRNVEGMVDVVLDATQQAAAPLKKNRLLAWHAALFPTGRSGLQEITTGAYRTDEDGPMQVVSGALGRETVHFEAPPAAAVPELMRDFIVWFNTERSLDPLIKAGVAHLRFLTLHPFDDGNGRIGRALTDCLLARADGTTERFYSFSAQVMQRRASYYRILEATNLGDLDITLWLEWFLDTVREAMQSSEQMLASVLQRHEFWQRHASEVSPRQNAVLSRVLDDTWEGKLTSSKYASLAKVSQDTAARDLQDLAHKGILVRTGGGRSTRYELRW